MKQVILIACATVLLGVLNTKVVNAVCCPADKVGRCGDNSVGTPYCGHGPCNMFGCNCDGGCRQPNRDARISDGTMNNNEARETSFMDTNKDGLVDTEEAVRFLRMAGVQGPDAKVSSTDKNGDGYLSNEEINAVSVEW